MFKNYLYFLLNLDFSSKEKLIIEQVREKTNPTNLLNLFELLKTKKLFSEAVRLIRFYLQDNPNNNFIRIKFSVILYKQNLFTESWENISPKIHLLSQNQEAINIYMKLCLILFRFKELRLFFNNLDASSLVTNSSFIKILRENNYNDARKIFIRSEFKDKVDYNYKNKNEKSLNTCAEVISKMNINKNIVPVYLQRSNVVSEKVRVVERHIHLDKLHLFMLIAIRLQKKLNK